MFQSANIHTLFSKDFDPAGCFENMLYKYNPYKPVTFFTSTEVTSCQIFLRGRSRHPK
jgi:hypothetical protein